MWYNIKNHILRSIAVKIIHCADIHIGSPLTGVANSAARRHELLKAFEQMTNYAYNVGAEAVVIAGDLLDKEGVTSNELSSLATAMARYPVNYFVVAGNHGGGDYGRLRSLTTPNVRYFDERWRSYTLGNVCISGMELDGNDAEKWKEVATDKSKYNIVVLHADIDSDDYGELNTDVLVSQQVNYVALGHRHTFMHKRIGKTDFVYSGVLEIRGFDERQDSGFVLIDTDSGKIQFVKQALRSVSDVTVDCNGVSDDLQLRRKVENALKDVDKENYINVTLTGYTEERVHANRIRQDLKGRFFALRIKDETHIRLDMSKLPQSTLAGRFCRLVMQELSPEVREDVVRMGLSALYGEELQ